MSKNQSNVELEKIEKEDEDSSVYYNFARETQEKRLVNTLRVKMSDQIEEEDKKSQDLDSNSNDSDYIDENDGQDSED